ncbi:hypothetical protein C5167_018010, partial [Papaver somniferum]
RIAGEIKSFSMEGWVAPKLSRRADKFMLYMLTAGKKALADGGISEEKRGATIYDEFLGGSFASDAYHMTEPHPEGKGVVLCIEKALAQSGVSQVHDRSPIRSSWSCGSCCTGAVEAFAAGAFSCIHAVRRVQSLSQT